MNIYRTMTTGERTMMIGSVVLSVIAFGFALWVVL